MKPASEWTSEDTAIVAFYNKVSAAIVLQSAEDNKTTLTCPVEEFVRNQYRQTGRYDVLTIMGNLLIEHLS